MRSLAVCFVSLLILAGTNGAQARDTKLLLLLRDAMNTASAVEKLDSSVAFYFGAQGHPPVTRRFGDDFTNKKTNAFNKDDKTACEWAFLSAMIQLQERAQQLGANAVINIQSYYKKKSFVSETEYECHAGGIIAGVALKGTFVELGSGSVAASTNASPTATSAAAAYSPRTEKVQRALALRGYDPGPVDGYMGAKTRDAIRAFQSDSELSVTGDLDEQTVSSLVDAESMAVDDNERGLQTDGSGTQNTASPGNTCTVEQILDLQKIGMSAEQISAACDA